MTCPDLRAFLSALGGDLLRVRQELDPRFEMAAFLRALPADGPAVVFEKVKGHPGARITGNLVGHRRRLARALGTTEAELARTFAERSRAGVAPVAARGEVPVQEVVRRAPADLAAIVPMLTHYERDAAPYVTSGVLLARDPATGRRGMGIHRMMFRGGNRLSVFLANPPVSRFLADAEAAGRPLEIAVALGLHPALLVAAVVRGGPSLPDKMATAGALGGGPVALCPAGTVDLEVPADAEMVIEGRVVPGLREPEGPFGENTGYYFTNDSPVVEVNAVTHRRDFLYPALCPWTGDVDALLSLAGGADLLGQLQALVYGVVDLEMQPGTAGFSAVISVRGCSPADVRRLLHLALNLDQRLKVLTVVDDDVDVRDPREVAWALATRYQPDRDTLILSGLKGYVIDPSATEVGAKVGFDATRGAGPAFEKVTIPEAAVAWARDALAAALAERSGG